eukprot:maker-scaffold_5-snap-gene-18.60-mRNA-1 protein AED:0.01 eAED:0.01 QI:233/1/1/1/1/1/2/329/579
MSPALLVDPPPEQSNAPNVEMTSLPSLFSTKRPKDCLAGLSSGLKNFLKGLGFGLAAFIGIPAVGLKEEGLSGFGKGLIFGVLSGILLPVGGAVTGIWQVGRGFINTKEAVQEITAGEKMWDKTRRQWVLYNLREEADLVLNETEEQYFERIEGKTQEGKKLNDVEKNSASASVKRPAGGKPINANNVKDMEFYNLLQVDSDATGGQIKKAYYLQARKHHPDKNKDNPESKALFQKIGAAYQVLSEPTLRAKYDRQGKGAVEDAPVVDAATMYMIIFGSEKFEYYVGELKLAMMMLLEDTEGFEQEILSSTASLNPFGTKKILFKQAKREVQCALNLVKLLNVGVEELEKAELNKSDAVFTGFTEKLKSESQELLATKIGKNLIYLVGYVYQEEAKSFLGFEHSVSSGLGWAGMKRRAHVLNTQYRLLASIVSGYRSASKQGLVDDFKKKASKENAAEQNPDEMDKMVQGLLVMVDAMWRYSVIDIESTLKRSARKALHDSSVSRKTRIRRAEALRYMGAYFKAQGEHGEAGLGEVKEKIRDNVQTVRTAQSYKDAYGEKDDTNQQPYTAAPNQGVNVR